MFGRAVRIALRVARGLRRAAGRGPSRRLAGCPFRKAGKRRLRSGQHCHGDAILAGPAGRVAATALPTRPRSSALSIRPKPTASMLPIWSATSRRRDSAHLQFAESGKTSNSIWTKGRPLIVALKPAGGARLCTMWSSTGWDRKIVMVNDPAQRKLLQTGPFELRTGMERGRKMDAAGIASNPVALIPAAVLHFPFQFCRPGGRPESSDVHCSIGCSSFLHEQRWQEIDRPRPSRHVLLRLTSISTTDGTGPTGTLGRTRSRHLRPGPGCSRDDKRFPLELAGVAFKQKHYRQAARYLRRALRLDPTRCLRQRFSGHRLFSAGKHRGGAEVLEPCRQASDCRGASQPDAASECRSARSRLAFSRRPAFCALPDLLTTDIRVRRTGNFSQLSV